MKRTIKLTESQLQDIINKVINETENPDESENPDMSKFRQFIPLLQKINYSVNMNEVIKWCNDNDVDYFGLNDLELIIIYIARNS